MGSVGGGAIGRLVIGFCDLSFPIGTKHFFDHDQAGGERSFLAHRRLLAGAVGTGRFRERCRAELVVTGGGKKQQYSHAPETVKLRLDFGDAGEGGPHVMVLDPLESKVRFSCRAL